MILIIKILILAIAFIRVFAPAAQKIVGVYKITNIKTGQCYIGKSKDIKNRWKQHFRDLDKGKHCNKKLQNAYNHFQIQLKSNIFIPEVLHICKTDDEAKAIELIYLSNLTIREHLYNLVFDPEAAVKRFEGRNALSSESCSISSSEMRASVVSRRECIKLVINNTKYISVTEASRHLNISSSTIRSRLKSSNFDNYNYVYLSYSDSGDNSINNLAINKDDYDDLQ